MLNARMFVGKFDVSTSIDNPRHPAKEEAEKYFDVGSFVCNLHTMHW
jgi:hypothetical protein